MAATVVINLSLEALEQDKPQGFTWHPYLCSHRPSMHGSSTADPVAETGNKVTDLSIVKYRFGFSSIGLERIEEVIADTKMTTVTRDEYFIDNYYDKESMVYRNTWKKKRVIMKKGLQGEAWKPFVDSPPLSIVKTEVKVSDNDIMQYRELRKGWEEGKDVLKNLVTEIRVHRRVLEAEDETFKIVVDRATFPDGDPHCTAALEFNDHTQIRPLLKVIREYAVYPIRSKIIEYMHRYDMKDTLAMLIQEKKVPDLKYRKSSLSDQWQSIPKDKFYSAWKRAMGTVGAPIAKSFTKEQIEEMRKVEDDKEKFDFEQPDDDDDEYDEDGSDNDDIDALNYN